MARTILVPLDATSESAAVLDTVRELARVEGATVRLLHVAPAPEAVVNVWLSSEAGRAFESSSTSH